MTEADVLLQLDQGGIGVMPTDTVFGLVASAFNPAAVERLYTVRQRDLSKPCLILISDSAELSRFELDWQPDKRQLNDYWPGPKTLVLPCRSEQFGYLHRGTASLGFRIPEPRWLRHFLSVSGPIIAPSANLPGQPPAKTLAEAKQYFSDQVDFYWPGPPEALPQMIGQPSAIFKFTQSGLEERLR